MSSLSVIDLTWCHLGASLANLFCCLLCGASAELNPFSHWGGRVGAVSVSFQHLHLLSLSEHQALLFQKSVSTEMSEMSDCWFPFLLLCVQRSSKTWDKITSLLSQVYLHHSRPTCHSVVGFFQDSDPLRSSLALSSGPLFVSVYVIAWQGSAPIRPCEGLNVIHWAETVLLPASLPFCLTPLMAAQYKRGQCHKRSPFIDERCWSVAHCRQDETDVRWRWEGLLSRCVVGNSATGYLNSLQEPRVVKHVFISSVEMEHCMTWQLPRNTHDHFIVIHITSNTCMSNEKFFHIIFVNERENFIFLCFLLH